MSFLARLFGNNRNQDYQQPQKNKLQDIPLIDLGIKGEEGLRALESAKDYSGMKFKSLELFNLAYDSYLASPRSDDDLELMYASMKNLMACELMWYYHDQIMGLSFGDAPEDFEVSVNSTIPFELPDSKIYHGRTIPANGLRIPLVDFYKELAENMLPKEKHFAYDILVWRRD